MNTIENIQHAIIGKFSYGWPDLEVLAAYYHSCTMQRQRRLSNWLFQK